MTEKAVGVHAHLKDIVKNFRGGLRYFLLKFLQNCEYFGTVKDLLQSKNDLTQNNKDIPFNFDSDCIEQGLI